MCGCKTKKRKLNELLTVNKPTDNNKVENDKKVK